VPSDREDGRGAGRVGGQALGHAPVELGPVPGVDRRFGGVPQQGVHEPQPSLLLVDQAGPLQFVEDLGEVDLPHERRCRPRDQVDARVVTGDRDQGGQPLCSRGTGRDPTPQEFDDACGHPQIVDTAVIRGSAVRQVVTGCEAPRELDGEEGMPSPAGRDRPAMTFRADPDRRRRMVGEPSARRRVEPGEAEPGHRRGLLRDGSSRFVGPGGQQQRPPPPVDPRGEPGEDLLLGLVGPVHVVEAEHERTGGGETVEVAAQGVGEHRELGRLQAPPTGAVRLRSKDPGHERRRRAGLVRHERGPQGSEGGQPIAGHRRPGRHDPAFRGEVRGRVPEQVGLAHPGRGGDEQGASPAVGGWPERRQDGVELPVATEQGPDRVRGGRLAWSA
jgi:hypothetical protein